MMRRPLSMLRATGAHATFFYRASFLSEHPELARESCEGGDEAGIEGPGSLEPGDVRWTLARTRIRLEAATLAPAPRRWRALEGETTRASRRAGEEMGYTLIGWSAGLGRNAAAGLVSGRVLAGH